MKGARGIISVGNRHEWPVEYWGWKDWEGAAGEHLRQPLDQLPLVTSPISMPAGFSLRGPSESKSDRIDRLLAELGIRPK